MIKSWKLLLIVLLLSSCKFTPYNGNDKYNGKAVLPLEEAPHVKNSLEWWYFTGHLQEEGTDNVYGIEYVFFHFNPRNKNDYIMVNVAVSDPQNQAFHYDYKITKLDTLLTNDLPINLQVEKKGEVWSLSGLEGEYNIKSRMTNHDIALDLTTVPDKPVLLHRGTGYEKYGEYAEAGYYSYPRITATGELIYNGEVKKVKGDLWYDRQWNCIGVWQREVSWDWLSVQFKESKEELMLYALTHRADGVTIYGGTHFGEDNTNTYISGEDIMIEELDYWESPDSKSKYPIKWSVKVPKLGYDLVIDALIPHQELKLKFTPIHKLYYWEGMCKVEGTKNGEPVTGDSYVEITNREKKPI
ncbi:MAG: lipocalin family protein [Bacteroidota bacterium]